MSKKPGRNSQCVCGSGKKHKHCHGQTQQQELPTKDNKNTDQAIFISAFAEALHDRKLGRDQNEVGVLLTGYSILHRRLGRCLDRAMKSLASYEERREGEGWKSGSKGSASDHLDDYLDCVYAAAELYEFYSQDVIKFLNVQKPNSDQYKSRIKKLRREITSICNQCKHEHGFLQAIDALYNNGKSVAGYCIYKRIAEHIRVNRDVHSQKEAFSLNWSLRRLLGNLMEADLAAAELVSNVPDVPSSNKIRSIAYTLPYVHALKLFSERSVTAMPHEETKPSIKLKGDELQLDLNPSPPNKNGEGEMVGFFDILGGGISFELPYVDGEITAAVNDHSGKARPFPGFMRAVIGGIKIKDE